jgi:hypothetical protein
MTYGIADFAMTNSVLLSENGDVRKAANAPCHVRGVWLRRNAPLWPVSDGAAGTVFRLHALTIA